MKKALIINAHQKYESFAEGKYLMYINFVDMIYLKVLQVLMY